MNSVNCLGYNVFNSTLAHLPQQEKIVVNTLNQYSYCLAREDHEFNHSLKQSDVLLPDGIGIVWAAKFLYGRKIKKIAGTDLHEFLLEKLNAENGSCFYMGSSHSTLEKIRLRIGKEYPNIRIGSYSPPYKDLFSKEDNDLIITSVNAFRPNVLFVGMTAPKQEKWSSVNKSQLDAELICSIGAVFDFYAGTVKRPGKIWVAIGLEWLGRLIKEPSRMWKRYFYYGAVFVYCLVTEKAKRILKA